VFARELERRADLSANREMWRKAFDRDVRLGFAHGVFEGDAIVAWILSNVPSYLADRVHPAAIARSVGFALWHVSWA
jgi:hypothetical protein